MKKVITASCLLAFGAIHAQFLNDTEKPALPKFPTLEERQKAMTLKLTPPEDHFSTMAFPSQFTIPGEFEESQAVVIQWPYPVSNSSSSAKLWSAIAKAVQPETPIWIVIDKFSDSTGVKTRMNANGTILYNYKFISKLSDAYWTRDWGPLGFYYGPGDSIGFVDTKYYPGRDNDDVIPAHIAQLMGVKNFKTQLRCEGGNFMTDGFNEVAYSSRLLENNQDELGWDYGSTRDTIQRVFGMTDQMELDALVCDGGTGHIDMYAKFMDEETIIITEYPNSVTASDKTTINNNINLLSTLKSVYNRPYKILKMPMPSKNNGTFSASCSEIDGDARGYINGLTVNKTFIVPIYSSTTSGNVAGDSAAIQRYRKILPGYRIVPIDARFLTVQGGAIHCVTMQIPADNPIRFWHPSVEGLQPVQANYPIMSKITNKSGIAQASCMWRVKGTSNWNIAALSDSSGYAVGKIPNTNFTVNDTIEYYLTATSNNGKTMTKPIVAPTGGYYHFYTNGTFTGINDKVNAADMSRLLSAQPNPANNHVVIPIYLGETATAKLAIYDMVGKELLATSEVARSQGLSSYTFDVSVLNSGIYFYTLTVNNTVVGTKKLVITR